MPSLIKPPVMQVRTPTELPANQHKSARIKSQRDPLADWVPNQLGASQALNRWSLTRPGDSQGTKRHHEPLRHLDTP